MKMQQNDVINRAAHISKPKKAEAFEVLNRILTETDSPAVDDLAKLYAYFLPNPPARAKTPEQWVTKAVAGKSNVRTYLQHMYSDGEYLIATNGHLLHGIPTKLPAGFYDTAGNQITVSDEYPDWRGALIEENFNTEITIADLPTATVGGNPVVNLIGDTWVNLRYLQAVANGAPTVTVTGHMGEYRSVRFTGPFPGSFAVIMPVRM